MNVVESFWLKNVVLYKEATFNFVPGVTVLQAVNLNRPGKNSNYSGKSLLFTSLARAMVGTEPFITKNAKKIGKDLFTKGTEIGFNMRQRDHSYRVTKTPSKLKVERDGKDLKLRTAALSSEYLDRLLGTTEQEFFSLYYIDSRRPNEFQFGTSSSRFEFFTSMFRLEELDDTRKWLKQQVTALREDQVVSDRVVQELKELGDVQDTSELKAKVKQLHREQERILEESRNIAKKLHLLDVYRMWKPLAKKARKLEDLLKVDDPRKELRRIDSILEELEAQKDKLARQKEQLRQREDLQRKLDTLEVSDKYKTLSLSKLEKLERTVSELQRKYLRVKEPPRFKLEHKHVTLEDLLGAKFAKSKDLEKLERQVKEELSQAKAHLSNDEQELREFDRHFDHHKDSDCPTCKTRLSAKISKSIRRNLLSKIKQYKGLVSRLSKALRVVREQIEYKEHQEAQAEYDKAKRQLRKLERYDLDSIRTLIKIKDRLDSLPKIDKVQKVSKEHDERQLRVRRDHLKQLLTLMRQLKEFPSEEKMSRAAELDGPKLKEQQKRLTAEVSEVARKLPKMQSKLDQRTEANHRREVLRKEAKVLKRKLYDLPLYEAMAEAYSSEIKQTLVKKIAQMIQLNMNHYAKIMYQEPYTFELSVKNNQFDAFVTRKNGGKMGTSDIRRMSGAESRIFTVLFALSILPLVPKHRRFNFMILDEPGENLDEGMVQVFREVLIPELSKIIPSVVVITPKDELLSPGCRIMTVVKKGSKSTLINGKYRVAANEPAMKKAA